MTHKNTYTKEQLLALRTNTPPLSNELDLLRMLRFFRVIPLTTKPSCKPLFGCVPSDKKDQDPDASMIYTF